LSALVTYASCETLYYYDENKTHKHTVVECIMSWS